MELDEQPIFESEENMTREEITQYIKSELANDEPEIYLDIDDYKTIVKALEQDPQIRPEGRWIPLGNYDDWGNESSYKCSECGEIDTYTDNFCPNCGADMREVEE